MIDTRYINDPTVGATAQQAVATADAARADALAELDVVRTAKSQALARERSRILATYGELDERIGVIDARSAINLCMLERIRVERAHATIVAPIVNETSWAMHGYVRDATSTGVAKQRVALYDAAGNWAEQYGYACTDDNGYYQLPVSNVNDTQKNAGGAAGYVLHVIDDKGATQWIDTGATTIVANRVEFREITLGSDPSACPPPDAGQRVLK